MLSVGEAIWSPRLYEYAAAIAPKGQEASYMALSVLPYFFAKFGASFAPPVVEGAPPAGASAPGRSTFAGSVWIRYTALALILAIMAWLYLRGGVRF